MKKQKDRDSSRSFLPIAVAGLAMAVVIILSKRAAPGPAEAPSGGSDSLPAVAVPDTALAPGVLPAEPESVVVALPDTLGIDKRPAAEAGYEDGYLSGMDDGATDAERATYDETSSFPTPRERAVYAENYRKGYAEGYEDGRHGRQFNIPER